MIKVKLDGSEIEVHSIDIQMLTGGSPAPPPEPPPVVEPPPVIDPPTPPPAPPPVDLGNAIPWTDISGNFPFGSRPSFQTNYNIPKGGLYVYFTVPEVTSFANAFGVTEITAVPSALDFSVSEAIGDMVGLESGVLVPGELYADVQGGTPLSSPKVHFLLKPNHTYFWNLRWRGVGDSGRVYLSCTYRSPI